MGNTSFKSKRKEVRIVLSEVKLRLPKELSQIIILYAIDDSEFYMPVPLCVVSFFRSDNLIRKPDTPLELLNASDSDVYSFTHTYISSRNLKHCVFTNFTTILSKPSRLICQFWIGAKCKQKMLECFGEKIGLMLSKKAAVKGSLNCRYFRTENKERVFSVQFTKSLPLNLPHSPEKMGLIFPLYWDMFNYANQWNKITVQHSPS